MRDPYRPQFGWVSLRKDHLTNPIARKEPKTLAAAMKNLGLQVKFFNPKPKQLYRLSE